MFYVALSRVRRWTDFILSRPFSRAIVETSRSEHFNLWNMEEQRLAVIERDM